MLLPQTGLLCWGSGAVFAQTGTCGRVRELQAAIHVLVMPRCLPAALPGGQASSPPAEFADWERALDYLNINNCGLRFQMQARTKRLGFLMGISMLTFAHHLSLTSGTPLYPSARTFGLTWSCRVQVEGNFIQAGKPQSQE